VRIDYEEFLAGLAIDLIAISVLTYALYFRRHQRRDLTLGLMGINVGLFAVSSFTATTSISIGFGIGLFALLSVIRLRSTVASQEEIGYYFVALVIGLVNGLAVGDRWSVAITLNVVLLGVMFVADHPRVLRHAERRLVLLKGVPRSTESLTAKLEDLLGYEVTRLQVLEIDYARRRTHVDVRFRTDRPVAPRDSTSVGGQPETPPEEAD
jgi:ABC-type cobalamin transport system permease subunit